MVFCLGVFGGMNKKVKYGLIGVIVFLQLHMIAGICVCLPKKRSPRQYFADTFIWFRLYYSAAKTSHRTGMEPQLPDLETGQPLDSC